MVMKGTVMKAQETINCRIRKQRTIEYHMTAHVDTLSLNTASNMAGVSGDEDASALAMASW